MPELPEVETIRARLAPLLVGRRLDEVRIEDERLTRPFEPGAVATALAGETVAALDRRGKYLIVRFETGGALLIHLRMTGTVLHGANGADPDDAHRRAVITLDNGADVVYRDVRRFGTWLVLGSEDEVEGYLASRLGPDPFDEAFTPSQLAAALAGRRAPVKAALLDQRAVAGMGNIYADEALWRAGIRPTRAAGRVRPREIEPLHGAVLAALRTGIERQGTTLRDFRTPSGEAGEMQRELQVYGREGEPCPRCGTPIEKIRVAGRGTSFCPRCQR